MHRTDFVLIAGDDPEQIKVLFGAVKDVFSKAKVIFASDVQNAHELLDEAGGVGLALVDLNFDAQSGMGLIAFIAMKHSNVMPVVVTSLEDDENLFNAFRAGAMGYILSGEGSVALKTSLRQAAKGVSPISSCLVKRIISYFRNDGKPAEGAVALTPRETEVLALLGRGMRVCDAAKALGLSDYTVGDYVKSIYRKLNISSRAAAAVEAVKRGLV